jgi:hypothetical protein
MPNGWARVRRPLIAGLAVVVVVTSFALLFRVGPGHGFFTNAGARNTSGSNEVATQQAYYAATGMARAQSLTLQFPPVAPAPGPGRDRGHLVWTMSPHDGTGAQCSTDGASATLTPRGGSSSIQWTTSDYESQES